MSCNIQAERDAYEGDLASIADFVNTHAREHNVVEARNWSMQEIKDAIDRVVFKGRHRAEQAEAALGRAVEALESLPHDALGIGGGEGPGQTCWSIRDELVADLRQARRGGV